MRNGLLDGGIYRTVAADYDQTGPVPGGQLRGALGGVQH